MALYLRYIVGCECLSYIDCILFYVIAELILSRYLKMSSSVNHGTLTRAEVLYTDKSQRFALKNRNFHRQYAHIYAVRLWALRSKLENAAKKQWGSDVLIRRLVPRLLASGARCWNSFKIVTVKNLIYCVFALIVNYTHLNVQLSMLIVLSCLDHCVRPSMSGAVPNW